MEFYGNSMEKSWNSMEFYGTIMEFSKIFPENLWKFPRNFYDNHGKTMEISKKFL